MRRLLCFVMMIAFFGGMTADAATAATGPRDFSAQTARVFNGPTGAALTAPSQAAPLDVVTGFLSAHRHGERTLGSLVVRGENRLAGQGLTHLRVKQEVAGLEVWGSYLKATLNDRGELVHVIDHLATPPKAGVLPARIGPRDAVSAALRLHHPELKGELSEAESFGNTVTYDGGTYFHRAPFATRVAVPMADGSMREGFLVETWSERDNLLHHTLVGGDGHVLRVEPRTNVDSYNIFPEHPGATSQQVVSGPGAGNAESPAGWLFAGTQNSISIAGNNVHAYLDADNNDGPDAGGTSVTDGNFLTGANLSQDPTTTANKNVAAQNLFYFNNVIHDKLYRHGFNEAAGNFQEDNFGNGGQGGDSVDAEGQDGGGTNNANFSTPSDGSNPRMQMYLWTQSNPRRDGDLDSDVIYHEYGHGLTWRMIGGMSGPMSGAIGEGMSDVLSILLNGDDVVGEYVYNNPVGIRSAPYTNYPRTYGDFGGSSVHFDGEIYAATIWRLWQLFQQNSISQDTLFDYIVGGMNFTPSGPAMENMRDGILQAASGSGHECIIWEAFAQFGIGEGAQAKVKGGGPFGGGSVTITESFQVPAQCSGCTITEPTEVSCSDGVDNDCDGFIDSDDPDCGGGTCTDGQPGDPCTVDSDCCSGKCRGPGGNKTCR